MSGDVFLEEEKVVAGAFSDLDERVHGGDFLELFLQKPAEEVLSDVVILLGGQSVDGIDLPGDLVLPVDGKLKGFEVFSKVQRGAGMAGISTCPPESSTN